MQTTSTAATTPASVTSTSSATPASTERQADQWVDFKVIRRNGAVVNFEPSKISVAMTKAFLAVSGNQGAASARIRELVDELTEQVVNGLVRHRPGGATFHIEEIQDQVELSLMRSGEHDTARAYVLYREKRNQERAAQKAAEQQTAEANTPVIHVTENGVKRPLDISLLRNTIVEAGVNLPIEIDVDGLLNETIINLYDGVPVEEVFKSLILAARTRVETDPNYSQVTARLLLHTIRQEVLGEEVAQSAMGEHYVSYFPEMIRQGVEAELLNPELGQFDLVRLAQALKAERDQQFDYLGLQTLYDRYFLHIRGRRIELPQIF